MNQKPDNKWRELCQAAATEQDSKKLMELVAEIVKRLDERHRKLKLAVTKNDRDERSFGISQALEATKHAKAVYYFNAGASSVSR
jgi:hypothetical protein